MMFWLLSKAQVESGVVRGSGKKKRKRTLSTASSNKIKNVNNAFFKTGP